MTDFSKAKLLDFLDFLGNKGLMNKATIASRKAATNTFLSILSDDEAQDLRKIDLGQVALRFSNLKGAEFKPDSIKVYKSRVASALNDLKRYRADPLSFKPATQTPKSSASQKQEKEKENNKQQGTKARIQAEEFAEVIFPVPIRSNVIVKIAGIPNDLTKAEASKIANVVLALATAE